MKSKKYFLLCVLLFLSNISISQTGYNMKLIANINEHSSNGRYSALWGYEAPNGREYAILGAFTGISFIDVTDTANVHEVGFVPTPYPGDGGNEYREMKVYSHYAYIVNEANNSGVQIVNLQYLPDSIHYVGEFHIPGHTNTHSISQSGPYLYLNGGNNGGLVILDLSVNPELPIVRGSWNTLYIHDSRIKNDTIWACNIINQSVTLINAANKDNLQTITSFVNLPPPASPHNCDFTADGKYLYVTDENYGPGRLKIWNIQDRSNIIFVRTWIPPGFENSIVHNVEIYGNYALLAYYTAGVKLLDISDPINPVEVAWYDTFPENNNTSDIGCWGVYMFPSGKIIASDISRGLFVLKAQLNQSPSTPVADIYASSTSIRLGESIQFLDISSGVPTNWEWTISNNNTTYTSNIKNPLITFNQTGLYNVKLKVSNSFGADSILRNNFITVSNPLMTQFQILSQNLQTINTSPSDTSVVSLNWTKSVSNPLTVSYKATLTKVNASNVFQVMPSNNNGSDTLITYRLSFLDSLAANFGTAGDSVLIRLRVWAYNGIDSLSSSNQLLITLKRTSVGINLTSTEIPEEYYISQNFPNPFNPMTKINFGLPFDSKVTMKIFDLTGREVVSLSNGNIHNAGYYTVTFDAGNLSSGVYFYRIVAEGNRQQFVMTKKMTLIK